MTSFLVSLLLSDNTRLQSRLRLILLVAGVYALSLVAQWHAVANGMADARAVMWLVGFIVVGVASLYLLVRLGLTLHLADPALTQPQMVFAILAIAMAYHLNPLVRGALPMLAGLVIMFGAFVLTPRQAIRLGWFSIGVFAITVIWGVLEDPKIFDPRIELHHFLFFTVVIFTMSLLTGQFSRLRTSWKQQNRELKEAMARLADSQRVMEQAKAAAEEANSAKSQFLANTSHEIRTPLNGILGMNELLIGSHLQPDQRAWAEAARASGQHLMSVINDILDFSRIEAGNLRLEQVDFDLRAVFQDVLSMLAQPAQAKGLHLYVDFTPPEFDQPLRGDPFRLRQIITNLVGNAVKFTERGSVSIKVHVLPHGSDHVRLRISVEDTGIGISAAAQERVFDNFSQGDGSTTRKYGGSGLGLAICRRLLNQMGGNISVQSTLNEGSVFQIDLCLPLASTPADDPRVTIELPESNYQPLQAASGPERRFGRLSGKVLLVEDNPVNQKVGQAMLGQLGLECELAENGAQALDWIQAADFDLVLMDCQMPVMDGYEATARIHQLPNLAQSRLPILAMTANAMPGDEQRCLDAGMVDFIAKPVTIASLHAKLERWLPAQEEGAPAGPSVDAEHASQPMIELNLPAMGTGQAPQPCGASILKAVRDLDATGGAGLGLDILKLFLENSPQDLTDAGAALASADAPALARAAHKLKSSASYVGADGLFKQLQALEGLARRADLEQAHKVFDHIQLEHAQVVDAAHALLEGGLA